MSNSNRNFGTVKHPIVFPQIHLNFKQIVTSFAMKISEVFLCPPFLNKAIELLNWKVTVFSLCDLHESMKKVTFNCKLANYPTAMLIFLRKSLTFQNAQKNGGNCIIQGL